MSIIMYFSRLESGAAALALANHNWYYTVLPREVTLGPVGDHKLL